MTTSLLELLIAAKIYLSRWDSIQVHHYLTSKVNQSNTILCKGIHLIRIFLIGDLTRQLVLNNCASMESCAFLFFFLKPSLGPPWAVGVYEPLFLVGLPVLLLHLLGCGLLALYYWCGCGCGQTWWNLNLKILIWPCNIPCFLDIDIQIQVEEDPTETMHNALFLIPYFSYASLC